MAIIIIMIVIVIVTVIVIICLVSHNELSILPTVSMRLRCKRCRPIGWALWQIANRSICKSFSLSLSLSGIDTSQGIHHGIVMGFTQLACHVMTQVSILQQQLWMGTATGVANCKCRDTVTWQLQNSWFYGIFMFTLSRKCMTNAWAANLPHIMQQHDTERKSLSCILHEPTKLYGFETKETQSWPETSNFVCTL